MNMMIIGLCGLALLPQTVLSQTRKVSLQECINMALEKNPQMQVANKSVERAKALQGTAWEIDKTELSLSQDPHRAAVLTMLFLCRRVSSFLLII